MNRKRFTYFFLLLAVVSVLAAPSYGQWKELAPNVITPYLQRNSDFGGAICFKDGSLWVGKRSVLVSRDFGTTWTTAFSLGNRLVMDISFFDADHGLVACYDGAVFVTENGGQTWNNIGPASKAVSAFFLGSTQTIVVCAGSDGIFISQNGGNAWTTVSSAYAAFGRADKDGIGYVLVLSGSECHLLKTTTLGSIWTETSGSADWDSYGFDIDKCDPNMLYLVNEDAVRTQDDLSAIYVSSNRGDSWAKTTTGATDVSTARPYFVGSVINTGKATFAMTLDNGIHRSIDGGSNWKAIGGPNSSYDSRFITAMNDNVVFAVDSFGSVWGTFNSGGDSIAISTTPTQFSFSSGKIITDSIGSIVRLPIYLHHNTPVPSVDMIVHYPAGPLQYLGSLLYYGKSIDVSGSRWNGRAKLHIDADDLNGLTDSLVGYAVFKWFPLEFDCATIHFDSIRTNLFSSPCEGGLMQGAGPFQGLIGAYKWCAESAVAGEKPSAVSLFTLAPNPAATQASLRSSIYSGSVELELYDIAGKLIQKRDGYISPGSDYKLNLQSLPSGVYHLAILADKMPVYELPFIHYRQ